MTFRKHLAQRGLNENIRAWVDYENELVYFPFWTLDGKLIGNQRYSWRAGKLRSNDPWGRYITKVSKDYKQVAFWGAEYFNLSPNVCFYTEGVWDAIRVINAGYTALAIFTCSPHKQLKALMRQVNQGRRQIMIGDNDENNAGKRAMHFAPEFLLCPKADPGDMTPEECKEWLDDICSC